MEVGGAHLLHHMLLTSSATRHLANEKHEEKKKTDADHDGSGDDVDSGRDARDVLGVF